MNDVNTYIKPAEEKMEMAVEYLDETLAHIRAGKANPKILDGVKVDYYGSAAPVSNVANISVPDARTIVITPWEKSMFKEIEKAIINSEIGITPENNGEVIRLSIPPLTEERRKALVKQSKGEAEQAKISVRNARRDVFPVSSLQVLSYRYRRPDGTGNCAVRPGALRGNAAVPAQPGFFPRSSSHAPRKYRE